MHDPGPQHLLSLLPSRLRAVWSLGSHHYCDVFPHGNRNPPSCGSPGPPNNSCSWAGLPDDQIQKGKDIKSISEIVQDGKKFKITVTTGSKVLKNEFTIGEECEMELLTGEKVKVNRWPLLCLLGRLKDMKFPFQPSPLCLSKRSEQAKGFKLAQGRALAVPQPASVSQGWHAPPDVMAGG